MTDSDALHHRGRALENAFFSNLDEKLVEDLRQKLCTKAAVEELRNATGIDDENVLRAVCKLGVNASTVMALRLYPMVAVAWADRELDAAEIETIRGFASKYLEGAPVAKEVLNKWLEKRPPSEMLDAWETYAHALTSHMPARDALKLKATLLQELNEVAQASGGLLGWGAVSGPEQNVVKRVATALGV